MRLDRFLWFTRISATRDYARALVASGHLRIDGRPCNKPAHPVRIGHVLTFADHRGSVRTLRVEALPPRRCSPAESRTCYVDLAAPLPANVSQEGVGD